MMSEGINDEEEMMMNGKEIIEAAGRSIEGAAPHRIQNHRRQLGEGIALAGTGGPDPYPQMTGERKGLRGLGTMIDGDGTLRLPAQGLRRRIEDADHLIDEGHILPQGRMEIEEADMIGTTDMIIDETETMDDEMMAQ